MITYKERCRIRKQSKELLKLNELYHKYLYLCEIKDIEVEKQRLRDIFNYGTTRDRV